MPVSDALKTSLHEHFDKTGTYIGVDVLAQVLNKQQGQGRFAYEDADGTHRRSYKGIVQYAEIRDRNNALQDGALSKPHDPFVDFKNKLKKATTYFDNNKQYSTYTLDFVLFDKSRAGGHFSRLSVTLTRGEGGAVRVKIENKDTLYPDSASGGPDARKNTQENKRLQATLQAVVTEVFPAAAEKVSYTIEPTDSAKQWKAGTPQAAAMCADEVVSDLLEKYMGSGKNPLARNTGSGAASAGGASSSATAAVSPADRRKKFVDMIAEAYENDEGSFQALLASETSAAAAASPAATKSPTQTTEHRNAPTVYDKLDTDDKKKTFLTTEFSKLCQSMSNAWVSDEISISVAKDKGTDRIGVNNNESTTVLKVTKQGESEDITLTRTYDSGKQEIKRTCTGTLLSWSQQCQLFAAAARSEAGDQATSIYLTEIKAPAGAANVLAFNSLVCDTTTPAPALSNQEKTCIAIYLEKFDSVIYQCKGQAYTFSRTNNQSLIGGQAASVTSQTPAPGGS